MTSAPAFSQRMVAWLIGVGGLSFLCTILLIAMGEDLFPTSTAQANTFSESAIGHKAFVETLRRLGTPVLVSRSDTAAKAGPRDLVVVAEPPAEMKDDAYLKDLLAHDNVLLVLPKWWALPQLAKRGWAEEVVHTSLSEVNEVLNLVAPGGIVATVQGEIAWSENRFGREPIITQTQLMSSSDLTPVIAGNRGILLAGAKANDGRLWVLSDPELISNQGLRRGDNAVIAIGMIEQLLPQGGTVIFDEVIHGFRRDPSLWQALFEFPFVIITLNALAAIAILIWAATGRFGAPVPDEPALKAGKTTLIGNAAGLLRFGGHAAEVLGRYLALTISDVARRVHAPAELAGAALDDRLERIGRARHVHRGPTQLRRDAEAAVAAASADERRLLHIARDLHQWKQEMLHGP